MAVLLRKRHPCRHCANAFAARRKTWLRVAMGHGRTVALPDRLAQAVEPRKQGTFPVLEGICRDIHPALQVEAPTRAQLREGRLSSQLYSTSPRSD